MEELYCWAWSSCKVTWQTVTHQTTIKKIERERKRKWYEVVGLKYSELANWFHILVPLAPQLQLLLPPENYFKVEKQFLVLPCVFNFSIVFLVSLGSHFGFIFYQHLRQCKCSASNHTGIRTIFEKGILSNFSFWSFTQISIKRQGGRSWGTAGPPVHERSGSSTKGRTPNIRYLVAKLRIVMIYALFERHS